MTDLLPALLAEHQPASTLERHLTEQLATVLRKQTEAEDNETYLLAKQPQYLLTHRPDGHIVPDPAYLLYNNRLDALRLHQARLGREQSRILRELHRLKRTPLVPKPASEPKRSAAPAKEKMTWVADIMADYDKKAAAAASEPGKPLSAPANEPAPAFAWPVLDDAAADEIEAMIASGDAALLEEAARRLGMLDGKAPVPPGILELYQSKLAG